MKKSMTLLFCALMALTASSQDLVIRKFADGQAPVIDGTVDAVWDLVDEVPIEYDDPDDYGITTIYDAFFKMGWNDSAIFLLVHRNDDDFADQWETTLSDWQSDRDEIFFDVNVDTLDDGRGASDSQQGASYGHYQFTSIWVQDADQWSGNPTQWYHNAFFYFGYDFPAEDEYYAEYAFPFTSLTINTTLLPSADATFQGGDGVIFGFLLNMADVDMSDSPTDETFRKFMRWVDQGGWTTMDTSGHVLMSEAVISAVDNNTASTDLYVYPSPAQSALFLGNLQRSSDAVIYDILGSEIISLRNIESGKQIDISALKPGTYIIRVDGHEPVIFSKL